MRTSLITIASLLLASPVAFTQSSTAAGYPTWDSDMINIENVSQTGAGVYVAVLDTGLVPNWRDYFPKERIATHLGAGFHQPVTFTARNENPCGLSVEVGRLRRTTWVGSRGSTHGTHVASTILGYWYRTLVDALAGYPLPPIMVRGISPDVTVIPIKVLADYQVPALPHCTDPGPIPAQNVVFGTTEMVVAGINYATDLAIAGYRPMVINMSLGGSALDPPEQAAIDRAIANRVIVVAAAGNDGEFGMSYPGAYAPVISAGSAGWIREWVFPDTGIPLYRMWWLQHPLLPFGSGDVGNPTVVDDVYVSDFSSRALKAAPIIEQELDVLAPGSWVRGPFPGDPGYSHLPWWSRGIGNLVGNNPGNFFYVGGTSMATPHVASVAALMLEKNSGLVQADVESIMKATALALPSTGSRNIFEITTPVTVTWDTLCDPYPVLCDPVGAGLIQADAALGATP